ncbi:MAG: hypothetical protein CL908_11665 [Deltaproteobacteria bacterium]|nr:hypothetical protein [Deltaproteobacteria bacterium]
MTPALRQSPGAIYNPAVPRSDANLPRGENAVGTDQVGQLLYRLEQTGLDAKRLASEVGLDPTRLSSTEARIERRYFRELFAVAEDLSGDSLIGLHAGSMPGRHTLLTYLTMSQSTVGDALREQARFAQLAFDSLRLEIVERPPYTYSQVDLGPEQTHHESEYLTSLWIRPLPAQTSPGASPAEVRFAHPPCGPVSEYERVLGCAVRFRQPVWAIAFSDEVLKMTIAGANPAVARALESEATQRLAAMTSPLLRARVEALLRGEPSTGARSPAQIAKSLGLSVRTLQRHLRDEGTTFREVRDDVRRQEAIRLLADPNLRISDVAEELGFRDVAGFDSTFKRWTGRTPRTERQRLLSGSVGKAEGTRRRNLR